MNGAGTNFSIDLPIDRRVDAVKDGAATVPPTVGLHAAPAPAGATIAAATEPPSAAGWPAIVARRGAAPAVPGAQPLQ